MPVQPWVNEAVHLAQKNTIDYGFRELPTITPESLIVAKMITLAGSKRHQDIDDIKEILKSTEVDICYVNRKLTETGVRFDAEPLDLLAKG